MPEPFDLDPIAHAYWKGYARTIRDDERVADEFERGLRCDPDRVDA